MATWLHKPIRGVLLDITGVLYNSGPGGGTVIEGSVEAVRKLKAANIGVRFVTNETQCTRKQLVEKLAKHGYELGEDEVFPPAPAVRQILTERQLRPYLLVHPGVLPEFASCDTAEPNCVVVGDAEEHFTFAKMNQAFQILMNSQKPILIAMGKGKFYKQAGQLQIDLGAYVAGLEYSCDVQAEICGKPAKHFFEKALNDMNVKPDEAVMIGDDIVHDVGGSQAAGLRGVLVRTGKFRKTDENHPKVKPDAIVDNLADGVEQILAATK